MSSKALIYESKVVEWRTWSEILVKWFEKFERERELEKSGRGIIPFETEEVEVTDGRTDVEERERERVTETEGKLHLFCYSGVSNHLHFCSIWIRRLRIKKKKIRRLILTVVIFGAQNKKFFELNHVWSFSYRLINELKSKYFSQISRQVTRLPKFLIFKYLFVLAEHLYSHVLTKISFSAQKKLTTSANKYYIIIPNSNKYTG